VISGPLRLRVFGELRVDGLGTHEVGSRKARTLLAVLALAEGRPVTNDALAEAVWGDALPAGPADQLGVLVSRLRRVLGADRIRRAGGGYALDADRLDRTELSRGLAEAARRLAAGEAGAALSAARSALALASGELLAGESGAWVDVERERVRRELARGAHVVAESALAVGDAAAATAAAQDALDADPYDEAALRLLMRAHVAAGRPASALAAFAGMRERLADELGADPDPATRELHERVLRERERPVASATAGALPGRDRELVALSGLLAEVAAGGRRVAAVVGEPGIGKSALVAALADRVRGGATVLRGGCDPLGRDLPLQPVLDGLEALLRERGREAAARCLGEDAALVAPLLGAPVATPAPVLPGDSPDVRSRLLAALLRVLDRAATGPALVVVDDVHAADPATLEWLRFAARRGERLLLVTTSRGPVADAPAPDLRIDLPPLDAAAARLVAGGELDDGVWERSGGNPLLLLALLRGGGRDGVPRTVSDAVAADLAALGDAAVTLRAAAVLGPVVDLDLLAATLERPAGAVLDDFDTGLRAGLLAEGGAGLGFGHELVREAAAAEVTASRRAFLHRRAAAALAGRGGHDPLQVAWHARRGGEPALAAAALVTASGVAGDRGDVAAGAALAREALDLHASPDAHLALATALLRGGDLAGAGAAAEAAIDAGAGAAGYEAAGWVAYYRRDQARGLLLAEAGARRSDDPAAQAGSTALAGRLHHSLGDLARAEDALGTAVAASAAGSAGTPRVWLAALRAHQGRAGDALDLADTTLLDPHAVRHPFALGHGWFARWLALGMLGRGGDLLAAASAFETAALPEPVRDRFRPAALNFRGWALRNLGALDAADEANRQAIERSRGSTLAEPVAQATLDLVETALLRGDPDDVRARLAAVELEREGAGTMVWHQRERLALLRAEAAYAAGAWDDALAAAEPLAVSAAVRGSRRHAALARVVVLLARARTGTAAPADVAAALADLDTVAGLESWRWTARAAAALGVDAWRADADARVARLAAGAGPHADDVRRLATRWLGANP
jgi:DNA-binding SARP family transcriptional activator